MNYNEILIRAQQAAREGLPKGLKKKKKAEKCILFGSLREAILPMYA
jgi:hypothetical protein